MELKRRKVSVSTILCIVMACMLALSIALSLTGAWFTDTAKGDKTITFGQVTLGTEELTITAADGIVPTQSIVVADTTYVGVAAYYRLSISVSNVSGGTATEEELNKLLGASTKYGAIAAAETAAKFEIEDIEISKKTGNAFQNVTCTLTVTLDVIQQEGVKAEAGLSDVADDDLTTENWEAIFAQCTDYSAGTSA